MPVGCRGVDVLPETGSDSLDDAPSLLDCDRRLPGRGFERLSIPTECRLGGVVVRLAFFRSSTPRRRSHSGPASAITALSMPSEPILGAVGLLRCVRGGCLVELDRDR